MIKQPSWKLWFPLVQIIIAIGLSLVGRAQYEHKFASKIEPWGEVQAWDYLPSVEVVLHSINYPAAIATSLTVRQHTFRIGIEYSVKIFLIYITYIFALWYVVGWCIVQFRYPSDARTNKSTWPTFVGLLVGVILLFSAVGVVRSAYALLIVMAAFFWSAVCLVSFSAMLFQQLRKRPQKAI